MEDKLLSERATKLIEPWFKYIGSLLVAYSLCEMSIEFDHILLTIAAVISIVLSAIWTIINGYLGIKEVFCSAKNRKVDESKESGSQGNGQDIATFVLFVITTAGSATVIMLISKLLSQ